MQPLKLAPACLGSRTRDGSHGTREKKPHYISSTDQNLNYMGILRINLGITLFFSIITFRAYRAPLNKLIFIK